MARARQRTDLSIATESRNGIRQCVELLTSGAREASVVIDDCHLVLTNLRKIFWRKLGLTKGDLLAYYAQISPYLLPHLRDRAMVMKRYPNGSEGEFFFMKRTPPGKPVWLETCGIRHGSGNYIRFPVVNDLAALLWIVNLGCIDLNQWYARCDDVDRPDYLHFDLDPTPGATFDQVVECARIVTNALDKLSMPSFVKTTGSSGIHIYVPIIRGPLQKEVWTFAKRFAFELASLYPQVVTAEYKIDKRPRRHVLVDYNQNAWGRTLASIYSVRPRPLATVSTPLRRSELKEGLSMDKFTLETVPRRLKSLGDLWKPILTKRGRFNLARYL